MMNIGLSSTEEFNAATVDMLASGLILFHPSEWGAAMGIMAMLASDPSSQQRKPRGSSREIKL